jgi:hypothetical protein
MFIARQLPCEGTIFELFDLHAAFIPQAARAPIHTSSQSIA